MPPLVDRPAFPGTSAEGARKSRRQIRMVTCIIRSEKLGVITDSLNKMNLVDGMTVTDVRGAGSEHGYQGVRYVSAYVPKVKVELVIEADDVDEVEKLVGALARTGDAGDGKIFVIKVADILRIRTNERGASAL
jgi:nitrogen regulatory protein P-II 1